jgi:hypothetical protein
VLAFVILLFLPWGAASARTTVTHLAAAHEVVQVAGPPTAPPAVTLGVHTLLHFAPGAPGPSARGGTQSGSLVGISGGTAVLPACGRSPCADSYRGAGTSRLRVGDWGLEVQLTVTQPPAATGKATGFSLQVAVHTAAGWTVVIGYFSTGTNPSATSRTIDLSFYEDLGVTIRPTLLTTDVVLSACAQAASCL